MKAIADFFDEHAVLRELKHFLPPEAPMKYFAHRDPRQGLHHDGFYDRLRQISGMFGHQVLLSLEEYRSLFNQKKVNPDILEKVITDRKGAQNAASWRNKVLFTKYQKTSTPRIGTVRDTWKQAFRIAPDSLVHPILFRILGSYLDQHAASRSFPWREQGLLASLREMEQNSYASLFKTRRARRFLLDLNCSITTLLHLIVGEVSLFRHYLFDQQFAHQGWSVLVSAIQDQPGQTPAISLQEVIFFELLLELDLLDWHFGEKWKPLATKVAAHPDLFAPVVATELDEVLAIWQEALEWSYYDQVLAAMQFREKKKVMEAVSANLFDSHRHFSSAFEEAHSYNAEEYAAANPANGGTDIQKLFEKLRRQPFSRPESSFEPARTEHTLCIIGRRSFNRNLFPGRPVLFQSYDYAKDSSGTRLSEILKVTVPLYGNFNLEHFFSHPKQTAVRSPRRLLFIVEQDQDVVLEILKQSAAVYNWFSNSWAHLAVIDPHTGEIAVFKEGAFRSYKPDSQTKEAANNTSDLFDPEFPSHSQVSLSNATGHFNKSAGNPESGRHWPKSDLTKRLKYTFYTLWLKEWNLDALLYRYLLYPFKTIPSNS